MIQPTTLTILFQLFSLSLSQSSIEYVITPDNVPSEQSCPNCLTLTQFAANVSHLLNDNTTLILRPGSHELNLGLVVSNITSFAMRHDSEPGNTLRCNQRGHIIFDSVQHVHITNVNLVECFGSKVMNTENFTLSNTSFTGSVYVSSGSALEIVESTALLNNCVFTKYIYGTYRWTVSSKPHDTYFMHRTKKWIGGALIITHSNVTIIEGNFTENRAQIGGAIYAENYSIITIIMSKFIFNTANSSLYSLDETAAGGALYATNNCSIFVNNSYFHKNQVYYGYRLGGTIAIYGGVIQVIGSTLSNSAAERGAVAYLSESVGVFNLSEFNSSTALRDGGVLYSVNSSLSFNHNVLVNNNAARGGVLFISQSTTLIQNCSFVDNHAIGQGYGGVIHASRESGFIVKSCQFKNNSGIYGAVMRVESTSKNIRVEECVFLYNRAEIDGGVFYFTNPSVYTQSAVEIKRTNVITKQSKFLNNEAGANGGVMFSRYSNLVIEDSDNVYYCNQAKNGSGGVMHMSNCTLMASNTYIAVNNAFQQGMVVLSSSRVTYSGTITFHKNLASAITVIESEVHFIGKINFTENEDMDPRGQQKGGAITSTLSVLTFSGKGVFSKNRAHGYGGAICSINSIIHMLGDTELLNNLAIKGGGMYLYQSELLCKSQLALIDNYANISGGGIHSLNSFIRLSSRGSLLYMRNDAQLGGGIFLTKSSKINVWGIPASEVYDDPWARRIRLIHNTAQYGGGIYIDDEANPLSCTASDRESPSAGLENECFFQAQTYVANTPIKYVFFNLNEASRGGSDLYGGLFDRCTPVSGLSGLHVRSVDYLQTFSNIEKVSLSVSSRPVRVCFCRSNQSDCDYQPSQVNVTKGQEFVLELVAVDQVNNTLAASINALTSSPKSRLGLGQQSQQALNVCTNVTYEVFSNNPSEELILYADGPCRNANLSSRSVHIHFLPCQCQAGFMVAMESKSACECICDEQLEPYLKKCNSSTSFLFRNTHAWINVVSNNYNNTTDLEGYLVHPHCPYDYCLPPSPLVRINLNIEGGADAQCAFDRSGMLCGACKPTFSLALGSSRCLKCSNYWLILLIPFSLAGIALVTLLLMLDINVSKGTLNGIVFYSNIVIANRAILIPLGKYNFLAMFISWLSLDLGIETCFADGLDTYSKAWLQFVFPTYIFILVFVIIVVCQYSQKFSNLLGGRNPIATLATLVWLSNAKYFRTILSVMSFTYLKYPNNVTMSLWLPDGNVHYLKGKHIPLFLVSLFILIAAMVYILVLLSWQWLLCLPKCKILFWVRNTKLMSLMDAYHAPYKGKHRYWPGLLLLISVVQYFISAFNIIGNPAVNLFAVIILVTALTIYKGMVAGVYRSWPLDILESTIHFNLILFVSSTMYIMEAGGNQTVLANISLGIVFVTFIFIVGYHILVLLFRDMTTALFKRLSRNGQRAVSVSDYLDDIDSHHLIDYTASKEGEDMPVTSSAEESTY